MQATANVLQMTKATTQGEVNVTHILSLDGPVPIDLFAISFFRQIRQLSRSLPVTPSTFRNMAYGGSVRTAFLVGRTMEELEVYRTSSREFH